MMMRYDSHAHMGIQARSRRRLVILTMTIYMLISVALGTGLNMPDLTVAYAAPLGNLPEQLNAAIAAYRSSLDQFGATLASKPSGPEVCSDTQLMGMYVACSDRYQYVQTLYARMQNRYDDYSSGADRLALTQAAQAVGALTSPAMAAAAWIGHGNCNSFQLANDLQKRQSEELKKKEDKADFLSDLLREALGDAEASGDRPGDNETTGGDADTTAQGAWDQGRFTRLLQAFDEAYTEFRSQSRTFFDLLNQLAACCHDEICENPALASSYASTSGSMTDMLIAYQAIVAMASRGTLDQRGTAFVTLGSHQLPNVTSLPIEDQLEFARVTARRDKALIIGFKIDAELTSQAPGCDAEDLADRGRQIGEQGQDIETGIDGGAHPEVIVGGGDGLTANFTASPTSGDVPLTVDFTDLSYGGDIDDYSWDFGDGGSSIATNPSHVYRLEGSYTVSLTVSNPNESDTETKTGFITVGNTDLRYERFGEPDIQIDNVGTCTGSTMDFGVLWPPTFLTPYRPNRSYQIQITVKWTYRGQSPRETVLGAAVSFLGVNYVADQRVNPPSTQTFTFDVRTNNVDWSQQTQVVTVTVGGEMVCADGSVTDGVSVTYTQVYVRADGN